MHNKFIYLIFSLLIIAGQVEAQGIKRPSRDHKVYFENTPNELNVYKLYGRKDGKTVFILGGIQGDEPGGFLSADLYPNLVLEKGNLIVVPRANFHSIILNSRGVNGDMNRRFDHDPPKDIDDRIVKIIKQQMSESDLFLNLHDGWGYYRTEYIDKNHSPYRFGQSVIADISEYVTKNGDTLKLASMGKSVVETINSKIEDPSLHFHFMNTESFDPKTDFPGMKKSATYFALTNYGIPAFGIESSKNLPSVEEKIRFHNYAINAFLKLMGIEPEHPAIITEPPKFIYMLLTVNGGRPQLVESGQTVHLSAGDVVNVTHIESNYARGLSCNILDHGTANDMRKSYSITEPTSVVVRKDNEVIGEVYLEVKHVNYDLMTYIIERDGEREAILSDQTLQVKRGQKIRIVDVLFDGVKSSTFRVNLKGYVPPGDLNSGEDRGYLIDTSTMHWRKYSLHGAGEVYPIVVSKGDLQVSQAFLSIQ